MFCCELHGINRAGVKSTEGDMLKLLNKNKGLGTFIKTIFIKIIYKQALFTYRKGININEDIQFALR